MKYIIQASDFSSEIPNAGEQWKNYYRDLGGEKKIPKSYILKHIVFHTWSQ